MDGRSRYPVVLHGDAEELAKVFAGYDKYLCRSCKALRLGRKNIRSMACGQCGSSNIDVETDMKSMRLEMQRLGGDPELAKAVLDELRRVDAEKATKP